MIGSITSLLRPSAIASSSRFTLPLCPKPPTASIQQVRYRGQLAPKRTKYKKAAKGAPGTQIPIGGSLKGTTLHHGTYGLRACSSVRISAAQLSSCQMAVRRKIKPVKGAQMYLRVFPDIPVCVKGNEQRMGKGKGSFEYWSCRVSPGKVIMEIGGGGIREEIAKAALKLAQARLPLQTEFITLSSSPRLGKISHDNLVSPSYARPVPNPIVELDVKDEGRAKDVVLGREAEEVDELSRRLEGAVLDDVRPATGQEVRA
ncbi:ribosomal protein L16 [Kwoniella mangroviensis CBS 10435]|uniref:Ribosomal protein L16 n=1 Tax=Kwoniella mangroviensis CBS 10435 TaxID=1331196 RepID=A0A1B9IXC7_9TREE|nr:ribosomal protein L16 [Kwoniella mangroviensis CBS 8507]OCF60183.1 ribosomal protein L16 [Kwoniella mangroviensis CBS 10435]OCF69443.1 ribosomal protein L16 [Kwoniella mangroviensis CBS 8507]OCF72348.1 ribosomal protein L16 [Kwoniella mangroviensis CBS 8886]